ncbi:hypothetical protein QTV49_000535 [Vibrio vulnificus]|nr:hypothetical protein [Vibrio vulnificus]
MIAFEITTDDLEIALTQLGKEIPSNDNLEELFDSLDMAAIEKAALSSTEMETQLELALEEIKLQIQNSDFDSNPSL